MSELLRLVVCPVCRGDLAVDEDGLRCTTCDARYDVESGVPVLLESDESETGISLFTRAYHTLIASSWSYDIHQSFLGARPIADKVREHLREAEGSLLDVGAGTGLVGGALPAGVSYVWLDNDRLKLRGFLSKGIGGHAVLASAAQIPLRNDSASWSAMVEVSHHLNDELLSEALSEIARVTRNRFLFIDAVKGLRLRTKILWQFDLGRFPRTEAQLLSALHDHFELETIDHFRGSHDHVLCVCAPKQTIQ